MMPNTRRDRLLLVYVCFFVSGLAGLIYEILWNKYLALFIGSTGRAHVMTLAVYMGGLALGSAVFGRRADRLRHPLLLYVVLEAGVGVLGLLYPVLFEPYRRGFIALVRWLGLTASALMAAKLVFCALTLLLPTFLMGGTLPVLGRFMVSRLDQVGPRVAALYYINTFGAFVGCLLAGFVMIPAYGLHASMVIAACLNFVVCGAALLLWATRRKGGEAAAEKPAAAAVSGTEEAVYPAALRGVVLVTIAISGFVAMVYEVAWIRLLTLVLGASTYSFSLMVATFIFGIGLGSFLISLKRRQTGYEKIYAAAEIGLGLSVLAMLPVVERVPFWFNQLATVLVRAPFAFGWYMAAQMAICFLLMLVPTVLLGMTLPAASRIATEDAGRVGRRVGSVYALNTAGTLLGAAAAGLVLLPEIGLKRTFETGIVLNLMAGLAVLWMLKGRTMAWVRPAATLACAVLPLLYWMKVPRWDENILSSGPFRQRGRFASFQAMLDMLANREKLHYYKDGVDASIAVVDSEGTRSLLINGKADASDVGDMSTQILISHFPLLTRPHSKQALVIGMGSGVSAGSALQYDIEHLDCVEISREVVEAALRYFAEANLHFAEDPRASIHIEDAKTFLQITPRMYDVIISEPTNPWIAGVAGLFSKEFFEVCREHLVPDGLVVQWIHVYEIQDASLMSVLRTFTDVFPYFMIWNMNAYDIAIVGSPKPFRPDFAWMEKQMAKPKIAADLKRIGIEHPLALLAMQMFVHTDRPADLFGDFAVNSDFHPTLEYRAPIGFFTGSPATGIKSLDMRAWPVHLRRLWIDQYQPSWKPTSEQFAAFRPKPGQRDSLFDDKPAAWADRWRAAWPDDPQALHEWIATRGDRPDWQREQLAEAARKFPDHAALADLRAQVLFRLFERNDPDSATLAAELREAVERARALHPNRRWPYARMHLHAAWRGGQMGEALKMGSEVFPHIAEIRNKEGDEAVFGVLRMIGEAAVARGRRDVAERCLAEMRQVLPRDIRLHRYESAVKRMKE